MPNAPASSSKIILASVFAAALTGTIFGFAGGYIAGAGVPDGLLPARLASLFARGAADNTGNVRRVEEDSAIIGVVKKASPAVVSITISKDVPIVEQYYANPFGNGDFFNQFFGGGFQVPQYRQKGTEKKQVGAGSGFLVSTDGFIVTNRHVVAEEDAEYTVIMQDGRKFEAKVLARDPVNDIAVLKIEAADLPFVPFGDSDNLEVGQRVVAIGYALGRFSNSVSAGIISGLQRSLQAGSGAMSENLFDVIQTDAAINPGNSGGPLLDLSGRAIGMNVAIVQGSQNIGFSLPINDVRRAVESVRKNGKISRAFLGVRYVLIDKELQQANQLTVDYGALVSRGEKTTDLAVVPGSPADKAGLVENDIILEVEGKKITVDYPLALALNKYGVGDSVAMKILHRGDEKTVSAVLAERK